MLYIFGDQAGAIPGIPGTFAHCSVEVDDEGNAHVISPTPVVEAVQGDAQEEIPAQEETIVQEQDAQSAASADSAVQPIVSMGG